MVILLCYVGSEFYIGFIPNFRALPIIVMLTNGEESATYSVEAPVTGFSQNKMIMANNQNVIRLPNSLTGLSFSDQFNDEYKEGVYLQSNRKKITVIGSNIGMNIETFFIIPTVDLCLYEYTYFAVSVSTNVWSDGSVVIVGTSNQTIVNITVPVAFLIKISNSENWVSLESNRLYSYEIQRLQIVYIAALTTDLTGTKVTTNKPISLFSGHECAFVPFFAHNCDNLAEQIPPTELWGTVYYFAPLANRTSYTIKIIAAYDFTTVNINCNNNDRTCSFNINAGGHIIETFENQEFCRIFANNIVLVSQLSHGNETDSQGDPMMTLIPAIDHYTNSITSSTFQRSTQVGSYNHYINIIVLASYYQPEMISITTAGGVSRSLDSQSWVPISSGNDTGAYATQVDIPHGVFELAHFNKSALMTVIVYGFEVSAITGFTGGYGHPGWLMDQFNAGIYIFSIHIYIRNYYVYTYIH